MNFRNWHSALLIGVLACSVALSGCRSRERRARQAFDRYQAASASGDLMAERRALAELVVADDKVSDYWLELGKVQLQLGEFSSAYNSFQRGHELDRANPSIMRYLTQLAISSGNLQLAEQTARELELVAPEDPAVRLTYGYVSLRRGNLDEATRQAKALIATNPYDSSANVLRARILLQSGEPEQAISLLREQVRVQPSDQLSLRTLLNIFELREQWSDGAGVARSMLHWQPKDAVVRARLIENEIRSGNAQVAVSDTASGLQAAGARELDLLLAPWIATGAHTLMSPRAFQLASKAQSERRIAMARFLSLADQPEEVWELTRDLASMPVTASNATANALYGAALASTGRGSEGLLRLNAVLDLDSTNPDALRGRAIFRSRTGAHKLAIEDAQKLIAADGRSPQARLLLERIYIAAGRMDDARRTLWDAFHDISAERTIYDALRTFLIKTGNPNAALLLVEEFKGQRADKMTRSSA